MYTTALVTPSSDYPSEWRGPSPWDLEKQSRAAARAFTANNQKLTAVEHELAKLDLADSLEGFAKRTTRRRMERDLADYIERIVLPVYDDPKIAKLPIKLRSCRTSGTFARLPDGKRVTLWDQKCGLTRLCPDESRNETHRLISRYAPAIESYLKLHPHSRAYSAVFTLPNFSDGNLKTGLTEIYKRFNALRKKRKDGKLLFPELAGIITVVEAPRSAYGNWNVHLNAIIITNGYLDYKKMQQHWHWNVRINYVKGTTEEIVKALKETVKYHALITPVKSIEKSESGKTVAPAMVQWPAHAWYEWYISHVGYHRTRSYGCMFLNEQHRKDLDLPGEAVRSVDDRDLTILGRVYWRNGHYEVELSGLNLVTEKMSTTDTIGSAENNRNKGPP